MGIKNAIKNSKKVPDVIFYKGDFGKEPMIIVFDSEVVIKNTKIMNHDKFILEHKYSNLK